jgi:hypothetical protein
MSLTPIMHRFVAAVVVAALFAGATASSAVARPDRRGPAKSRSGKKAPRKALIAHASGRRIG